MSLLQPLITSLKVVVSFMVFQMASHKMNLLTEKREALLKLAKRERMKRMSVNGQNFKSKKKLRKKQSSINGSLNLDRKQHKPLKTKSLM